MNASNETIDLLDDRPIAQVIPFPKPRAQQLKEDMEKEYEERITRIRNKIQNINRMIQDSHSKEK